MFSLPIDASALNLRRERYELARLVHQIAAVNGKAIELRVLQYGVTRQALQEALDEDDGWDVVHVSGHGLPAGLLLEQADGRRDLVSATELVDLLDPGRKPETTGRLRWPIGLLARSSTSRWAQERWTGPSAASPAISRASTLPRPCPPRLPSCVASWTESRGWRSHSSSSACRSGLPTARRPWPRSCAWPASSPRRPVADDRRHLAGERDADLVAGLDPIVTAVLDQLANQHGQAGSGG